MKEYLIELRIGNGYRCTCCYAYYELECEYSAKNLADLLNKLEDVYKKRLKRCEEEGETVSINNIFLLQNNGATKTDISGLTKDYYTVVSNFEKRMKQEYNDDVEKKKKQKLIRDTKNKIKSLKKQIEEDALLKQLRQEEENLKNLENDNSKTH